ncbi:MAG: flavodoxin domain-containing protein [Chloroflexota bacterium]
MANKILVTFTSRTGWTVGVAEAIGKTLAESGATVDVLPMRDVNDLSAYDAVVAGSAINNRAWRPEAAQWVRDHQAELKRKPFAAFLVCMTLAMKNGEQYRSHVATWLDPVSALVKPVGKGLFAGGLDIRKVPAFKDRLMFRLSVLFGAWTEGDHRDWNAIRAWAESLRPILVGT